MTEVNNSSKMNILLVLFITLLVFTQLFDTLNTVWSNQIYLVPQVLTGVAAGTCGLLLIRQKNEKQDTGEDNNMRTRSILVVVGAVPLLLLIPLLGPRAILSLLLLLLIWWYVTVFLIVDDDNFTASAMNKADLPAYNERSVSE